MKNNGLQPRQLPYSYYHSYDTILHSTRLLPFTIYKSCINEDIEIKLGTKSASKMCQLLTKYGRHRTIPFQASLYRIRESRIYLRHTAVKYQKLLKLVHELPQPRILNIMLFVYLVDFMMNKSVNLFK